MAAMGWHVWLIEDDRGTALTLATILEAQGMRVSRFDEASPALRRLRQRAPDCVLLDLRLPGMHGMDALRRIRLLRPDLPVIVVSSDAQPESVVEAMRLGAQDYLVKPVAAHRLVAGVERAVSQSFGAGGDMGARPAVAPASDARGSERASGIDGAFHGIVGGGPIMRHLVEQIRKVAATDVSVFIGGESGVGKDLVAQAIHAESRRAAKPYVAVNCGALSESLQDSELFGHEKGAFTGAAQQRRGVFERAQGGTVFLDEVAELSPGAQVRLLRVLQSRQFVRLGGEQFVSADVRILSATHQDLRRAVDAGRFREDLFYRLVVYPIWVPPLRDHVEDLPALVQHFARRAGSRMGCGSVTIAPDALACMEAYPWPGNVRELENVVQRALVESGCGRIEVGHLPPEVCAAAVEALPGGAAGSGAERPDAAPAADAPGTPGSVAPEGAHRTAPEGPTVRADARVPSSPYVVTLPMDGSREGLLAHAEREAIIAALVATQGRVVAAARKLGMSRATLYRRLQQYGLSAEEFRERTERMGGPEG